MATGASKDLGDELQYLQLYKKSKDNVNWDLINRRQEGEIFVIKLIQDLVQKAGDVVYEHYIQRRVVPFAVVQAQKQILNLTEVSTACLINS